MEKIKIGLGSFTDPRSVDLASETEGYTRKNHQETAAFLKNAGFEVLDPCAQAQSRTVLRRAHLPLWKVAEGRSGSLPPRRS